MGNSPPRPKLRRDPTAKLRGRAARGLHRASDLAAGGAVALGAEHLVLHGVGGVAVEIRRAVRQPPEHALPDDLVVLRVPQHGSRDRHPRARPSPRQRRPPPLRLRYGRLPRPRLVPHLRHHDPLYLEARAAVAKGA